MKEILETIFSKVLLNFEKKMIGHKIYISLDEDRKVELCFVDRSVIGTFQTLRLSLVHKEKGPLHSQLIDFEEIFSDMDDQTHPNKIRKHIWYYNQEYKWYGKPTSDDIKAIQKAVIDYVNVWY